MITEYKPIPTSGVIPVGYYTTPYGRVWVKEREPEWVHDTLNSGHYENRYTTRMECVDGEFQSLVTWEIIEKAFKERDYKWRLEDAARW